MQRQGRSKNRRFSKTSSNTGVRNSENRGGNRYSSKRSNRNGYRSKWRGNNRRKTRGRIDQSKYVSRAEKQSAVPAYIPEHTFNDFGLHGSLIQNISKMGFVNPTKIQDQAIPEIMKGKDILGIANTGSGKTGAFLIPTINKSLRNPGNKVLIVTPTRELASQINAEFRKFTDNTPLRMVLVIGGANIRTQIGLLRRNPQFVVATPGRLMDLVRRNCIDLRKFNNVVLDEVDQMLDMGFVNDIKFIVSKLGDQRQSLFFSATMSPKEESIANTLLNTPVKVESHKHSPLKNIHQDIVKVRSKSHKMEVLSDLVNKTEFNKVLVFSGTKYGADNISKALKKSGIRADSLHGDKSQNKRSRVLATFREDKIDVLVATDVASRGIDIPDISHVINYDEPATYSDYVHRIGRTGRIGKTGTALTFVLG